MAEKEGSHGIGGVGVEAYCVFQKFAAKVGAGIDEPIRRSCGGVVQNDHTVGTGDTDLREDAIGGELLAGVEGAGVEVVGRKGKPAVEFDGVVGVEGWSEGAGSPFDLGSSGGGEPALSGEEFGGVGGPIEVAVVVRVGVGRNGDAASEGDRQFVIGGESSELSVFGLLLVELIKDSAGGKEGENEEELREERTYCEDFDRGECEQGDGGKEEGGLN